jgi:hypothetical protein
VCKKICADLPIAPKNKSINTRGSIEISVLKNIISKSSLKGTRGKITAKSRLPHCLNIINSARTKKISATRLISIALIAALLA